MKMCVSYVNSVDNCSSKFDETVIESHDKLLIQCTITFRFE